MSVRGFTLLEVLIAVAISAIIGVLITGAFARTHATKELVESFDDRYSVARLALGRIARELEATYVTERFDTKRFRERPTHLYGDDGGERDTLRFTTFAHQRLYRDAKESDQSLVEYRVDRDPDRNGEMALIRREKVHLDEDPGRGGTEAVVADNVSGFEVSYWDWKRASWAKEWDTNSTDRPSGQLPTRVKLKLTLKMPDGKEKAFETQSRLAMIRPMAR
jgi:general secretion pathway protein J